jgi:hypothetical protein
MTPEADKTCPVERMVPLTSRAQEAPGSLPLDEALETGDFRVTEASNSRRLARQTSGEPSREERPFDPGKNV